MNDQKKKTLLACTLICKKGVRRAAEQAATMPTTAGETDWRSVSEIVG